MNDSTPCEIATLINCRVPMRDGVTLSADVYLPGDKIGKPLPVYLSYSPYQATGSRNGIGLHAAREGFAGVCADVRGLCHSGGGFSPWNDQTVDDAWDLLEWISKQPWCDGHVAMVGGSYPGATQLACLRSGHPVLTAVAPSAVTFDPYSIYYANGAQVLAFQSGWHIGICTPKAGPVPKGTPTVAQLLGHRPLAKLGDAAGMPCPSWEAYETHDGRDAFWAKKCDLANLKNSRAGVFYQGSWYDKLGVQVFETFKAIQEEVTPETATSNRRFSCLRVGPWGHGVNTPEGEIDFFPEGKVTEAPEVDFLHSLLADREPTLTTMNPTPIQIFVMGKNIWRFEKEWPLARAKNTPVYLGSAGAANTAAGNGTLSFDAPANDGSGVEASDHFAYNPDDPVPSCGGRMVGGGGQRDQTEIEKRHDVLVYTGDVLDKPLEVTGPVTAVLYVASSALDTDFTVKLVDLFPDGRPMSVLDGILRCRFRDGLDQPPRNLVPGETTRLEFFVDVTSYCFLPGHRIRVEISSSNFPHFFPNPNTGAPVATETNCVVASQTVFHTAEAPSHLVLPVIPEE